MVGVAAGASIAGMHFIANQGIPNYHLTYSPYCMAGSWTIAIGICLVVLWLFYSIREKWISAPWKRALCAMALAAGASAMHFTAATDCQYTLKTQATVSQSHSMDMQVAIASAFCVVFAIGIGIHIFIARWRERRHGTRSQQVTLAWMCFDKSGRLAVTSEGILPSRKITHKYPSLSLDEEFDTGNPAFQWLYRVSRAWSSVGGLVPDMKSHIRAYRKDSGLESPPISSRSSAIYDADTYSDAVLVFKEKALVAAASLATLVNLPLESLGVLADRVFETGTLGPEDGSNRRGDITEERTFSELESGVQRPTIFGKGKVLFITKEASETELTQLLNSGLRIARVQHVKQTIANAMRVDVSTLELHISELKRFTENLQLDEKPGTWLSFFAMLPKPNGRGFDVVVKKSNQNQLPDVQLMEDKPQEWQQALLNKLDGEKVPDVLQLLEDRTGKLGDLLGQDLHFIAQLQHAIVQLTAPFPQEWVRDARLWSRQLTAHYSHVPRPNGGVTTMYAFTVIGDVHASIEGSDALARIPRSFFDVRHRVYPRSPDHNYLAQEIRNTFNPIFAKRCRRHDSHYNVPLLPKLSVTISASPIRSLKRKSTSALRSKHSRGSLARAPSSLRERPASSPLPRIVGPTGDEDEDLGRSSPVSNTSLGGIRVDRSTSVRIDNRSDISSYSNEPPRKSESPMGKSVTITAGQPENTFVDALTAITKERFRPAFKAALH